MRFWKPGLKVFLAAALVLKWAVAVRANSEKQSLDLIYKQKFAEVLQQGLVIGNCSGVMIGGIDIGSHASVVLAISDIGPELHNKFGCATQQLRDGEALFVEEARIADHGRTIWIQARTVAPHS